MATRTTKPRQIEYPETDGKHMVEAELVRLRAELVRLRDASGSGSA